MEIVLISLAVLFFLLLFLLLLLFFLGFVFSFFNFIERKLGQPLSKLLFGLSFVAGLYLLLWGWGNLNVHGVYTGAFLVVISTLYFLSESTQTY
jgi:hypothetical protein